MPYRDASSIKLEAPEPCAGNEGFIRGRLYYVENDLVVSDLLLLGDYAPDMDDPDTLVGLALEEEQAETGKRVSPEAVVALDSMRLCFKDRHDDKPHEKPATGRRIERFRAILFAEDPKTTELLRPLKGVELAQAWAQGGITEVRRHNFDNGSQLRGLTFPLTEAEERQYQGMALRATKAAAKLKLDGWQPDIMLVLHPKPGGKNIETVTQPKA